MHYLKNRKPGNCSFSFARCMLLCQRTHRTHSNYDLITDEHLSFAKPSTVCSKPDNLRKQRSIAKERRMHGMLLGLYRRPDLTVFVFVHVFLTCKQCAERRSEGTQLVEYIKVPVFDGADS